MRNLGRMERDDKPTISVIVPVYNVEPYLRKCLDSILNQTYKELEILIIDDGSSDASAAICDEYLSDDRVRVFHTKNHGLSTARNLGLDHALGQYIGFVDSDDWIEPDMYKTLMNRALETGADAFECGFYLEYKDHTEEDRREERKLTTKEAITALLDWKISDTVWNKLWKRKCYEHLRFPENRVFEEIATTWRAYMDAESICTVSSNKYHYLQRKESLSKRHDMKSLVGYWLSHKERFVGLYELVESDSQIKLLWFCAKAVSRMWAYYFSCSVEERLQNQQTIQDMNVFTKKWIPLFGYKGWELKLRIGVFFPHFLSSVSLRTAWILNRLFTRDAINMVSEK